MFLLSEKSKNSDLQWLLNRSPNLFYKENVFTASGFQNTNEMAFNNTFLSLLTLVHLLLTVEERSCTRWDKSCCHWNASTEPLQQTERETTRYIQNMTIYEHILMINYIHNHTNRWLDLETAVNVWDDGSLFSPAVLSRLSWYFLYILCLSLCSSLSNLKQPSGTWYEIIINIIH